MVGRTQRINGTDKARFEAFQEIGCVPCAIESLGFRLMTVQHVVEGMKRAEDETGNQHAMTWPGCEWHHLGLVPPDCGGRAERAEARYGPSLAHNKRGFVDRYGPERDMIAIADAMVRIITSARRNGEWMPPRIIERLIGQLHTEIVIGNPPSNGWEKQVKELVY
jgi:hypothetical protein